MLQKGNFWERLPAAMASTELGQPLNLVDVTHTQIVHPHAHTSS